MFGTGGSGYGIRFAQIRFITQVSEGDRFFRVVGITQDLIARDDFSSGGFFSQISEQLKITAAAS